MSETPNVPMPELPPVSREALEANLRSTHANLNACIEQRQRLEEQIESLREERDGWRRGSHQRQEFERRAIAAEEQLKKQSEALEKNRDLWRRRAEFYGELHDTNVVAKWIADEESSPAGEPQ